MSNIKVVTPESLGPCSEWKLIGTGHFGDVFKTKYKELKIPVAVKKLKENTPHLQELLAEAGKIKHASENYYVIQLHGIMEAPPCIVMEWVECGCLGALIETGKEIPWALKYRFLHEVALGMNWLHCLSPPLLHLDLKPRNVLLNDALHIRITDFGLSKYTNSSIEANGGTIEYMPPEAFQEGYSPSEASDVYSFAILSAVVLKGDDPYQVQCSSLIRMAVCDGQRPNFESLEKNINSVKNLKKAIAFTVHCWDKDKQKRPSFQECCDQWETFISAYEDKEIKLAVQAVQNLIDSPVSTTDVQQSASAPNTKDMSDLIKSMQTVSIREHPSAKLEAVPPRNPGSSLQRGSGQHLQSAIQPRTNVINHGPSTPNYMTGAEIQRNPQIQQRGPLNPNQVRQPGQGGFSHRPNSSVYRTGNAESPQGQFIRFSPAYPPGVSQWYPRPRFPVSFVPQGFQYSWPIAFPENFNVPLPPPTANTKNISLTNNEGPCQIGDNNQMSYGVTGLHHQRFDNPRTQNTRWYSPTSYHAPPQTVNIQISDNTGAIQIGDNNTMFVRGSSQYRSDTKPITPQPGQTARISSLTPTKSVHSSQPSLSSQVRLPTKEGEAFSDAAQPTQETERQTYQPLERATTQDTTVSNSLQGKDNIISSSSSGEQNNSKQ